MLDKINKINTSSDFSKSTGTKNYNTVIKSAFYNGFDSHDSADISPAFKYLIQVHWRIIDFRYNADSKLFLNFIVSGIEFQLTVDLLNYTNITSFNYQLFKKGVNEKSNKKIAANVITNIEWIDYDQDPVLINFSALNIFFDRLFEQRIYPVLTKEDIYFFDDLLGGIIQDIRNEFSNLNNQVLIFFYKLTGKKNLNKLSNNEDYIEPLLINKINILDV